MDKQYINSILHAPKLDMRQSFKQQIEIIYKLENTICTTLGNKLTLLDIANGKAVGRMSQISQLFLSTKNTNPATLFKTQFCISCWQNINLCHAQCRLSQN